MCTSFLDACVKHLTLCGDSQVRKLKEYTAGIHFAWRAFDRVDYMLWTFPGHALLATAGTE